MSEGEIAQPEDPVLCPSGRCREGSVLIGIVGKDGRLGHINPALPVDAEFVARASAGRTPESRFRFSEACAEGRCAQWAGDHCGLIEELLDSPQTVAAMGDAEATKLPRCGIRPSCRWFEERGPDACGICPLVVHTRRVPANDGAV